VDENKICKRTAVRQRHLRPEERAQVLALWAESGMSGKEVARQTGVSRQSLARWKLAARVPASEALTTSGATMVEVPASPVRGAWAAGVVTRHGAVRLSELATPRWAAQLLRELNAC
jgi:transposase-like protein